MRVLKEGFQLFPDQLENAKALVRYRRALFVDSTGSGKCKLPDSRVHFNGGFPKIEDICEAEFGYNPVDGSTYAPNGSSVAVTNIYRQEDVDVNVFTTKSGIHPNGTDAHRLLCATSSGLDMTYLRDVKTGDYIAKPYFPIFSEVDSQLFTQCILYGIVLGDGCMSYGSRPNVLSYVGTEPLIKWIRSVEQPNRVGGIRNSTGVWEYRRTRKDSVISWLVGDDLRTSGNKEVSEKVYSLSASCRFAVLYGYLSADGSASDGCCEFTTKSESLCRGLCDIMDSLNISYRVTNKDIYKRVILHPIGAWTLKQYCTQYDSYLFKGCDRFLRIATKLQDSKKDRRILRISTQFLYEFLMGVRDIPDLGLRKKWQNRYSTIRKRKYLSQELLFELVSLFEELGIGRLQGYRNLYFDEIVSKSVVRSDVYDFTVPDGNLYLAFDGVNHNTPTILYSFAYLYAKRVVDGLVVFTPRNAHEKEVWKPQIQQFTNFKCINFEDVEKQYEQGRQIVNILKGYQIVYCKHTNFKGNYPLCVEILDYFQRPLTCVDECFSGNTPIYVKEKGHIVGRSIRSIVERKIECEVPCIVNGKLEYRRITHWFDNGERETISIFYKTPIGVNKVRCTKQHLFQTSSGWKEAGDLKVGDSILSLAFKEYSLNSAYTKTKQIPLWEECQEQVLLGTLLGDSGVSFNKFDSGISTRFFLMHGEVQRFYLEEKRRIFSNVLGELKVDILKDWGKERPMFRYQSKTLELPTICKRLYVDGKKVITRELLDALTPLSLSVWFMDDGSRSRHTGSLCTHCFSLEENQLILEWFKEKYGIECSLQLDKRCNKYYIRFLTEGFRIFVSLISSWVLKEFQYKLGDLGVAGDGLRSILPLKVRCEDVVEKYYSISKPKGNPTISEFEIVRIGKQKIVNTYDLEVEGSHSYIAGGLSAHNCHYFRNPASELSVKASMGLTHTYALWGITATDLSRNSMDTYNIINFVRPGKLGTKWDFMNRFCITKEKVIGRLPGGKLKKAKEVVGFKSISEFREYLSDTLVIGTRTVDVHIHEVPYTLNERERNLYSKIAGGFCMDLELDDENWLQSILRRDEIIESSVRSIKDVERHSSRYIYLQSVVDGAMNSDGTFGLNPGSKSEALLNLVKQIAERGESALIFFDYYVSLDNIEYQLKISGIKDAKGRPIKLIETSGRKAQKANFITKSMCDLNSYFVLCSRASSESENFPFINNVIFYNIPTTPITYLQFIGRITRRNTLYPGNLHVWMLLSENIDLYKLTVIGHKMHQMKATTYNLDGTFPQKYMQPVDNAKQLDNAKKHLLWKGAV